MKKTVIWTLLFSILVGACLTVLPISADETSNLPKSPIALDYQLDEVGNGMADGVVTVTLPAGHKAEDIYLFWGDDNGKLPGYTALSPFKVASNVVTHRIAAGTIIPKGATRLLAYSSSDILGMSESYASFTLPAGAAMTDDLLGTLQFEFQAVSDIHLTRTVSDRLHHSDHMRAMLEDIMEVSPNSIGIFNNGDTVNNGLDADYEEFLKIYAEFEGAPTIYSGFGNHELFRFGTGSSFPTANDKFEEMKDVYWNYLGGFIPQDATFCGGTRYGSLTFSFEKNGSKFIFIGTDTPLQNDLALNDSTLEWIEDELEEGKGAPTFIIMHQPMTDTLAATYVNSYGVKADTATKLKAVLANYPEVIMFNGHSHRDMNQYGTHYQRDDKLPSIFGTSSVGYLARNYDSMTAEKYAGSEGYYVYVYEDKVLVLGRDFLNGEWISSAQFMVDLSEDALEKEPKKEVQAPLYNGIATLYADGTKLSGIVSCNLPTNHNATAVALFFSSEDTGIIGSNPFATYEVDNQDTHIACEISFADVTMSYTADYILVYSYSETLGWSADCDVIDLKKYIKGGGAPVSGSFSVNKYSFTEGEKILVTAYEDLGTSWIGIRNIASTGYTWNYWKVKDVGIGTAVDLSKDNSAFGRAFTALTPGVYEIGWIKASNSGGFLETKTPEHTTTFVIHSTQNVSSSGVVKADKLVYQLGDPIHVTALKGEDDDWIGMQRSGVSSGTKLWYRLSISGVNQAFDITERANYVGISGRNYKFSELEAGKYQLAWVSSSKSSFQSGKTAEDTIEIIIVDASEPLAIGVPIGDGVTDPDVSILEEKLMEIEKLNSQKYTSESWQILQNAVSAALLVMDNSEHTQEEIDAAYEGIVDAIAALVAVPITPDLPKDPPDAETDSSETITEITPDSQTATPDGGTDSNEKTRFGCGGVVGLTPSYILLALIPIVIKQKNYK